VLTQDDNAVAADVEEALVEDTGIPPDDEGRG
jgi:hypothetical protein